MHTSVSQDILQEVVPQFYDGIVDFEALFDEVELNESGQPVAGGLAAVLLWKACEVPAEELFSSQHIGTATETGIRKWEQLLGIGLGTMTLEERRQLVLSKLQARGVVTKRTLYSALNNLGGSTLEIDYGTQTVVVDFSAPSEAWYKEVLKVRDELLPLNLLWEMTSTFSAGVSLESTITAQMQQWNYKLGSWSLGSLPFRSDGGEVVVKLPGTPSLLEGGRALVAHQIEDMLSTGKARVRSGTGEWLTITALTVAYELVSGVPTVTVSYEVPNTVNPITEVELRTADDSLLETGTVYVPNADGVVLKHYVRVLEGGA